MFNIRKLTTLFTRTATQPSLAQSPKSGPHTLSHTAHSPPSLRRVQGAYEFGLFRSGYPQFNHHKQGLYITTSKISNSSIPNTTHWFTKPFQLEAHLESRLMSAAMPFCGNSQCPKAVGCFPGGAPSWMFGRILNATLPNNVLWPAEALRKISPPLGLYNRISDGLI